MDNSIEENSATDRWAEWLFKRRFQGDQGLYEATMGQLRVIRDAVLQNVDIREGDVVLDIGTGDGLLGFKALDLVGRSGRVIFSDVSERALDVCREIYEGAKMDIPAEFVQTSADTLEGISDGQVDVVVGRAVLIYVHPKPAAFRAFYRVLRPGGRISFAEPISSFKKMFDRDLTFFGFDLSPLGSIAGRVLNEFHRNVVGKDAAGGNPMLDFDERDLMIAARDAGFDEVNLELSAIYSNRNPFYNWEAFFATAPNPNSPSLQEAAAAVLDADEFAAFVAYLRPLVENAEGYAAKARAMIFGFKRT